MCRNLVQPRMYFWRARGLFVVIQTSVKRCSSRGLKVSTRRPSISRVHNMCACWFIHNSVYGRRPLCGQTKTRTWGRATSARWAPVYVIRACTRPQRFCAHVNAWDMLVHGPVWALNCETSWMCETCVQGMDKDTVMLKVVFLSFHKSPMTEQANRRKQRK